MSQPAAGGTDEGIDGLVLRVLTRDELVARLLRGNLGAALEVLAHDQLLKERIAKLEAPP